MGISRERLKSTFIILTFLISNSLCLEAEWERITLGSNCQFSASSVWEREYSPPTCELFKKSQVTEGAAAETTCPEHGVLRIVGEYDVVRISCNSAFPLDFNFDGVKPTEAILVTQERLSSSNVSRRENFPFRVTVEISSVQALYNDFHRPGVKNSSSGGIPMSAAYSRTGAYTFSGFHDLANISAEIYIFFEDPSLKPEFITTTDSRVQVKGKNYAVVPCRPSHFNAVVTLREDGTPFKEVTYSPVSGFNLSLTGYFNLESKFACRLVRNKTDVSTLMVRYGNINGGEKSQVFGGSSSSVYISSSLDELSFGTFGTRLICRAAEPLTDGNAEPVHLNAIGADNAPMFRLRHQLTLPRYMNRSYSLTVGKRACDCEYYSAKQIDVTQVISVFCGNRGQNSSLTLSTVLSGETFQFDFDQEWRSVQPLEESKFHWLLVGYDKGDDEKDIYEGDEVEFKCRISSFVLAPPNIWYVMYKNGTMREELVDYNWKDGVSYLRRNVSFDMQEVICAASVWVKNEWWNVSVQLDVKPCSEPQLEQNETATPEFSLHSKHFLKCTAYGTPMPYVYWIKNRTMLTNKTIGSSFLEFPDVKQKHEGDYTCVSESCGFSKSARKTFRLKVYRDTSVINAAFIVVIAITIIVISWIAASIYIRYSKKRRGGLNISEIEEFMTGEGNCSAFNFQMDGCINLPASSLPYNKQFEVSKSRFQLDKTRVLGKGATGIVYKGLLDGRPVAVKTVRNDADASHLKSLLAELKVMMYIGKHENLIQLLGACTKRLATGKAFVLVDYCQLGALNQYLKEADSKDFTLKDMYNWSMQIASGMEYLGKVKVIHGDLAARNVLLTHNKMVKITDFGLSRRLYDYSDYVRRNEEKVPWRWLALESLRDSVFSFQSDIWSYGVTLWEIFSLAETPYPDACCGLPFVTQIEQGMRLTQPAFSSNELYAIMTSCWNGDPSLRPSFESIRALLKELAGAVQCPPSYVRFIDIVLPNLEVSFTSEACNSDSDSGIS